MRLEQAMREKIHMYDQCLIALGHDPDMGGRNEEIEDMIFFLETERDRVRTELKDLEDGTHELFTINEILNNPGNTSNADIATMLLDMKE